MNHIDKYGRNFRYLHDKRINLSCLPWSDEPTSTHDWGWYYEYGTYQRYALFSTPFKINSARSLSWHLLVIRFLNQDLTDKEFSTICEYIADTRNNFAIFEVRQKVFDDIISYVLNYDLNIPPKNKLRKFIFRPNIYIPFKEKMRIVGSNNKKATVDADIIKAMEGISDSNEKITEKNLSETLGISKRTLSRRMTKELIDFKKMMNEKLRSKRL